MGTDWVGFGGEIGGSGGPVGGFGVGIGGGNVPFRVIFFARQRRTFGMDGQDKGDSQMQGIPGFPLSRE